jgi:HSF-type DNA-binding
MSAMMDKHTSGEPCFVEKVYDMLEAAEREGFEEIVRWGEDGKSFKVHKTGDFETKIQPIYFNQTRLRSFQRKVRPRQQTEYPPRILDVVRRQPNL